MGRDHDDGGVRMGPLDIGEHIHTAHPWKFQIENHEVEIVSSQSGERLFPVGNKKSLVPLLVHGLTQEESHARIILDDENFGGIHGPLHD